MTASLIVWKIRPVLAFCRVPQLIRMGMGHRTTEIWIAMVMVLQMRLRMQVAPEQLPVRQLIRMGTGCPIIWTWIAMEMAFQMR